jgi:hypothetical protein
MSVALVVRLSDARPNASHQFVVVGLTVVKATVGFTERIGLLSGGNKVTFWRETRYNGPFFPTSWKVTHRFFVHVSSTPMTLH